MAGSKHAVNRVEALRLLAAGAAPHRRALLFGLLATLGVVAARLALPWPLRGVVENVFPAAPGYGAGLAAAIGLEENQILVFCGLFFLLAVATGAFEWTQRVWMARAASQTAHDLRAAAVAALARGPSRQPLDRGDLITRIIGDSARIKADLKGIFIHLTQNGMLLLAITVLFLFLAPYLGLLFLAAGLLAILIGYGTVEEVAETTSRQRGKESKYAAAIPVEALEEPDGAATRALDRSSVKKEVRITKIIGRSALAIHAAVAATLGLAFWVGVQQVRGGTLAPGELFLFIAYAITIQRRAVMIGRQVARGGKVLANVQRLGALLEAGPAGSATPLAPPRTAIRLEQVRLRSPASHGRRSRLGPLDVTIPVGQHLLVLGGDGAGKTALLEVLAGRERTRRGRILWDEREVGGDPGALRRTVALLPRQARFAGVTARGLLGLDAGREPSHDEVETLDRVGAWKVVRQLRHGLDQSVASTELSERQARSLALGGIVLGEAAVWCLDEPVDGDAARDRRLLETVLERAGARTLIVALRKPALVERFDRVIVLRKGKIDFEGSPEAWNARREQIRKIRRA